MGVFACIKTYVLSYVHVCVCVCVCNFCTVLFYQTIYFLHRVNHHGVNHHGNDVLPSSLMATAGHGSWHCCTSAQGKIKASPHCLYQEHENTLLSLSLTHTFINTHRVKASPHCLYSSLSHTHMFINTHISLSLTHTYL